MPTILDTVIHIIGAAILLGVCLSPLAVSRRHWAVILSACLTAMLLGFIAYGSGIHLCDQGGTPIFVVAATSVLGIAAVLILRRLPVLAVTLFAILIISVLVTRYLSNSYHRPGITGNQNFATGRFWHTPFTGMYPAREEENEEQYRELQQSPGTYFRKSNTTP